MNMNSELESRLPGEMKLRIGTRGSDLALWQARYIQSRLRSLDMDSECRIIKTRGDRMDHIPFSEMPGKGFFTKELEEALLEGHVDLAVHSLKDLATEIPEGLCIAALVGREDPSELLIANPQGLDEEKADRDELLPLREGARIGTSAARRQAQVSEIRPDLEITELRGNVPTRIRKLREGRCDAILLASAGVSRLGLDLGDLFVKVLPVEAFIPAPGQGMLAVQCRKEKPFPGILSQLHCADAARAVEAERYLQAKLEGGCRLPFGAIIQQENDNYRLDAFWKEEGSEVLRLHLSGSDPLELARDAYRLIAEAARKGAA
jgi:hydroxymethylbilane synthase